MGTSHKLLIVWVRFFYWTRFIWQQCTIWQYHSDVSDLGN